MLILNIAGDVSSIVGLAVSILSLAYSFQQQKKMSRLPQTDGSSVAENAPCKKVSRLPQTDDSPVAEADDLDC